MKTRRQNPNWIKEKDTHNRVGLSMQTAEKETGNQGEVLPPRNDSGCPGTMVMEIESNRVQMDRRQNSKGHDRTSEVTLDFQSLIPAIKVSRGQISSSVQGRKDQKKPRISSESPATSVGQRNVTTSRRRKDKESKKWARPLSDKYIVSQEGEEKGGESFVS